MAIDWTIRSEAGQAVPPPTERFAAEAFGGGEKTVLRWLGMAGFLVNSRGTVLLIDAVLRDFDMPLLIDLPLKTTDVPRVSANLVTHSDNDHFSRPTARDLAAVTDEHHGTRYVAELMREEGLDAIGHDIGDRFTVGAVTVTLTPADHAWQNARPRPG